MADALPLAIKPTLTGTLVVVRPVSEEDARGLASVEAETRRLTGTHGSLTLEDAKVWYRSRADHDDRVDLSIIERATRRWIGEVF